MQAKLSVYDLEKKIFKKIFSIGYKYVRATKEWFKKNIYSLVATAHHHTTIIRSEKKNERFK